MALQWADTFNKYGTNTSFMLDGLYADVTNGSLVTDPDLTSTQTVYKVITSNVSPAYSGRRAFPSGPIATAGVAFRLWTNVLPSIDTMFQGIVLSDIANVAQIGVKIKTTGALEVLRGVAIDGSGGTTLATTATPVVAPNSYNHFEIKATIDNTVGAVEVRINGVTVINITGVDTQATANATVAQTYWQNYRNSGLPGNNPDMYLKDFIIWDTTGSFNNNFFGPVLVLDQPATSDVSLTWSASTGGTGFGILDNNPPLDDAAYISAATNLTSVFGLADLPVDVTSVRGLVMIARARKEDAGDGTLQMGMKSGVSTGLGIAHPITTAYTYWYDINETDPATGVAWTPAAFNAATFQIARTA